MNTTPKTSALLPWRVLQDTLSGSFNAQARGLLSNTFVIRKDSSVVGHLVFNGLRGAEFTAETLKAIIERTPNGKYALFSDGSRILTAVSPASSLDALEIACGEGVFQARISFLHNLAEASSMEGSQKALLKGNMVGRRYEIEVEEADPAALPVAILLLYHTAIFRRRAYVT